MSDSMTSMQRVLTTLAHEEPDRVPLFLLVTMHGARELGLSIRDYFSRAEHVVEGQLRLREKYGHDCLYPFFHAALEHQAMGGEVIFVPDGPPNAGPPLLCDLERVPALRLPQPAQSPVLAPVLRAIESLKARVGDEAPIIGVVISPFSLPVMQLGFAAYLDLLHERLDLFDALMALNEEYTVEWANAQLAAGATAICYFDPVSSPTIIPREIYLRTGFKVAQRTIPRIEGPTATHLASGRALAILDDLVATGTAVVGTGSHEDLLTFKAAARDKLTVLGNLDGVSMCRWTPAEAEQQVREAIGRAGSGGGFILAENHGEVPFQVPEETLLAVAQAARRWGRYPLMED